MDSSLLISRRRLLTGIICAPIICRSGLLMPIKPLLVSQVSAEIVDTISEGPIEGVIPYAVGSLHVGARLITCSIEDYSEFLRSQLPPVPAVQPTTTNSEPPIEVLHPTLRFSLLDRK